jgi:uncharacterized protein YdeI (YjbR/CyaY-like superfamily)
MTAMKACSLSRPDPPFFPNAQAFRGWLRHHAHSATELLVAYHKVATGWACMSWTESVDEALCFGWIDGVRRRLDTHAYVIRFTPRQPSSIWSAVNIAKVESLRASGRMTPAGEKAFALRSAAKSAVYAHEQAAPAELSLAEIRLFKRQRNAWRFFYTTPPGYQKFALHWVTSAKREATRAGRLIRLIEVCDASDRRQ